MSLWHRVYQERRALILPLLIALIANVVVLLVVVWPLQQSVAAAHADALAARAALAAAKRLEMQATQAATRRTHAEEDLQRFYGQILPRDFPSATRMATQWLQQAASDAGLEFQQSRFDVKEVRESALVRASSTVTLVGRYADLRRFLTAMEAAREFVVLESVQLAQPDDGQQSPNDSLEIALAVSTFFPVASR